MIYCILLSACLAVSSWTWAEPTLRVDVADAFLVQPILGVDYSLPDPWPGLLLTPAEVLVVELEPVDAPPAVRSGLVVEPTAAARGAIAHEVLDREPVTAG